MKNSNLSKNKKYMISKIWNLPAQQTFHSIKVWNEYKLEYLSYWFIYVFMFMEFNKYNKYCLLKN